SMETRDHRTGEVPERGGESRGHPDGRQRLRLAREKTAAYVGRTACSESGLVPLYNRQIHSHTLHVREQLSGRSTLVLVHGALESIQETNKGFFAGRTLRDVPRHRDACLPASPALAPRGRSASDTCARIFTIQRQTQRTDK